MKRDSSLFDERLMVCCFRFDFVETEGILSLFIFFIFFPKLIHINIAAIGQHSAVSLTFTDNMSRKRRSKFSCLPTFQFSPLIRSIPLSLFSALISVVFHAIPSLRSHIQSTFDHPYPFQIYAFIVGFALVFRSNIAFGRFWEGRTGLQWMGGKWCDVAIQCRVFDSAGFIPEGDADKDKDKDMASSSSSSSYGDEISHLTSLLHALALQSLRGDNLTHNNSSAVEDPSIRRYNLIEDDMSLLPPKDDATFTLPFSRRIVNLFTVNSSDDDRQLLFASNPIPVIGGLSKEEAALIYGDKLSENERVSIVMERLMAKISNRFMNHQRISPPIMSRVFQVLSDGHNLGYMSCRKIADTPIPIPYSLSLSLMVVLFCVCIPFVTVAFLDGIWVCFGLTWLSSWSYCVMHQTAKELENPFNGDTNDLPICRLQWEFNQRISKKKWQ